MWGIKLMATLYRFYFDGKPDKIAGFIPVQASENDPRPLREQFDSNYPGGWNPVKKGFFTVQPDGSLLYPGDPPIYPIAFATLRKELLLLYEYAWVRIMQHDGKYEIARMD